MASHHFPGFLHQLGEVYTFTLYGFVWLIWCIISPRPLPFALYNFSLPAFFFSNFNRKQETRNQQQE